MGPKLDRRMFLGAAGGTAATALLTSVGSSAQAATGSPDAREGTGPDVRGKLLIPEDRRGIILYTVRDAIARDPLTTDAPSGFFEVLQYLSALGYANIEFAGYNQHANARGGANPGPADPAAYLAYAQTLRGFLDELGLQAIGNHGFIPATWGSSMTPEDRARFELELEFASVLGMPHMGTGGDPTSSNYKADWDLAAEKWNALGEIARSYDKKLYTHNHDAAYDFLLDSPPNDEQGRPTRSSGIRKLEYFLTQTDSRLVWLQMDIYWAHVAQHRFRTYTAPDGSSVTNVFDPAALVAANARRYPLFHSKDGIRTDEPPGVGSGYVMVPFGESGEWSLGTPENGIDYTTFISRIGSPRAHYMNYEQDNAPGDPATAAFQSLLVTALSHRNMSRLKK